MLKNKKIIVLIIAIIAIITIIITIIFNNMGKKSKIGKNSSSQEIVDYILNISEYESEIEVEVKSNKNSNKYKIKQTYIKDKMTSQEVIEPSNIQGVKIIKEDNNLRIENTKLSLSKIIENYNEITQNNLDLISFIENYKKNTKSVYSEKDNQIIMETTVENENKYQKYEKLTISKETEKPVNLEIRDTNKNIIIYIIYNEININEE
jgi:outer membrane lipoprotein-sorting protein